MTRLAVPDAEQPGGPSLRVGSMISCNVPDRSLVVGPPDRIEWCLDRCLSRLDCLGARQPRVS